MNQTISDGVAHKLPADLKKAFLASPKVLTAWESLTPLARNEWICWVESVKKQETRDHHVERAVNEIIAGKRRPCCWLGCVHRADKPMNATQKYLLGKKSSKKL